MRVMFEIAKERHEKAVSMSRPYTRDAVAESALLTGNLSEKDRSNIENALNYLRHSNFIGREANYMAHAVRVALYFKKFGKGRADGISLGLLHNIYEVTDKARAEVIERFGQWISDACEGLVVDREKQKSEPDFTAKYYARLAVCDTEVRQIKIFDKLDNILVLFLNPSADVRKNYLAEIQEHLLPMVRRDLPKLEEIFQQLLAEAYQYEHQTLDAYLKREGITG